MPYSEHKIISLTQFDRKRHIDCTCIEHSELSDHPHVTTFAEIGNLLSFLYSECHKTGSDALCLLQSLLISRRFPYIRIKILLPKERILRILGNVLLHEVDDCQSFCHNSNI